MQSNYKLKILGILLIVFGLGVPAMPWIQVGQLDTGTGMAGGFLALILIFLPIYIIPIISGFYAFMATAYKFVITGTIVSLIYCLPLVSMAVKFGFILGWVLSGISLTALIFVIISQDDFL